MNVDIKPHHVARVLAILCALPIFWVFVVQGVTTTTTYDVSAGDFSSSSDFGEDVPSSVELRWRSGEHQAALT
ncbi:hypothetical protein [Mycolicibacterium sp.]|uniref:hypothetical protein n=1 Tax=Mycolicibacterium sp. TaxID=2320850 RepID=UPI003D09D199